MSNQSEETRQADWILPPCIDTTGLRGGTPNAVQLAASATAVIVDLTTIPPPSFFDPEAAAVEQNPLGHYVCLQARGADIFLMFGSSFASMTPSNVSSVVVTNKGLGYGGAPAPSVTFSGGGASVQATGHAIINSAGEVQQVIVDTPGTGYTSAPAIAFGSGAAAATAILGAPPNPAEANTVSATTGAITMAAGASLWIPAGSTANLKLPAGRTGRGKGNLSAYRFLGFVTSGAAGTLHVWQSSP